MTSQQISLTSAVAWIVVALALGWATDIQSAREWTMLAIVMAGPLLTMRHFWRVPAQTMSESIRAAQR